MSLPLDLLKILAGVGGEQNMIMHEVMATYRQRTGRRVASFGLFTQTLPEWQDVTIAQAEADAPSWARAAYTASRAAGISTVRRLSFYFTSNLVMVLTIAALWLTDNNELRAAADQVARDHQGVPGFLGSGTAAIIAAAAAQAEAAREAALLAGNQIFFVDPVTVTAVIGAIGVVVSQLVGLLKDWRGEDAAKNDGGASGGGGSGGGGSTPPPVVVTLKRDDTPMLLGAAVLAWLLLK